MFRVCGLLVLLSSFAANSTTYYFSNLGSDHNSGRSLEQAWKTFEKLTQVNFMPGDEIVLDSQSTFTESLKLTHSFSGSPSVPVVIRSSNKAQKATIKVAKGNALELDGVSFVIVENLSLQGPGGSYKAQAGSNGLLLTNSSRARRVSNVVLREIDAWGFRAPKLLHLNYGNGIIVKTKAEAPGFENLLIDSVNSWENAYAGIQIGTSSWQNEKLHHSNVKIFNSKAFMNKGMRNLSSHSGSGIVAQGVQNLEIAYNQAYQNGENNEADGGPVGIWAWGSKDVWIHHNIARENRTSSKSDGGGFDLDGGITNAVVEYNYSEGNDGAGFLLCTFPGSGPVVNAVVRNNISVNDGQKNVYGGLVVNGNIRESKIYNNIVWLNPSNAESSAAGFQEIGRRKGVVQVEENLFIQSHQLFIANNGKSHKSKLLMLKNNVFCNVDSLTSALTETLVQCQMHERSMGKMKKRIPSFESDAGFAKATESYVKNLMPSLTTDFFNDSLLPLSNHPLHFGSFRSAHL